MIRDYLFSDVVGYDNMEKIRPEFVLDCQNKIYNKILILKYNNYEVYKKIISFLYLEYLNLQEIESKFSESASYLYLKNENVDLNFILELVDIEDNFLYELIRSTITIYVLNKKHVKMSFNEKLEEKWNPYYEMEKIAYNFEHNDYEKRYFSGINGN